MIPMNPTKPIRPAQPALAALLLALTLAACTSGPTEPVEPVLPRALTTQEEGLITSGNLFGLSLFRAVSAAEGVQNVFLSPLSVSMALGMTLNGAEGATRTAMVQTLELAGLTEDEINAAYCSLIDLLTGLDNKVVFEIANSIWYREGLPIDTAFVGLNESFFDAVVQELDFSSPEAVPTINGWVDAKTHGKIEEILSGPIDPLVVMYLINAIYFNGDWTWRFDANQTADRPFYLTGGGEVEVPAMRLEADLPYYSDESFQAVDLPYGDGFYSMTVLLPQSGEDLDTFITGLDAGFWSTLLNAFTETPVKLLQLPKFRLEYEIELSEVLSALGMGIAFDADTADFSRMITEPWDLFISRVLHKTFVEVDEEGTEAAAVTAVEVSFDTSVGPGGGIYMVVDRPFVFVLRERLSGTILFIGKYIGPD